MAGLGETAARLARQRRELGQARPLRVMSEVTSFGADPGELRMLGYRPENLPAGAPLVVALHGCTQRGESFAQQSGWLTLADRLGFAVIAPEQRTSNNSNRCFNWYEPADARRGEGEAASIAAMVQHAIEAWGVDPARVFVMGLSAGGAMTSVMLATYPELFAAGAVIAGMPYGVAQNLSDALAMMFGQPTHSAPALGDMIRQTVPAGAKLPRVAIWHGDADSVVRVYNGVDVANQWADAHGAVEDLTQRESFPGRTRAVWRKPGAETPVVELNLIEGFGHGTPLAAVGPDGVGTPAPHMLEAGVSSSLEIARFWGLTDGLPLKIVASEPVAPLPASDPLFGMTGMMERALRSPGFRR